MYIRDFEAIQNTHSSVLSDLCKNSWLRLKFLNMIIHSCSFFKQYRHDLLYVVCNDEYFLKNSHKNVRVKKINWQNTGDSVLILVFLA